MRVAMAQMMISIVAGLSRELEDGLLFGAWREEDREAVRSIFSGFSGPPRHAVYERAE
jgi:hypothetical protein